MSREFQPVRMPNGTMLQAGIPTRPAATSAYKAGGLMLRGVVTATYVADSPAHPAENAGQPPVAVYCDVLCYINRSNQRWAFFPQAMVLQDRGAMHSGRIWKPRATSFDITGVDLDIEKGTSLSNMDGDWVLLGFLDDNPNMPIVLGGIPHPNRDLGNEDKDAGHRMKLKVADGDPDFWKHKGAFYGIDKDGNFTVDTTEAFATDLETDGKEPVPAEDGSTGNYNVKLPLGSKLHVEIDGTTNTLEFTETMVEVKLDGGATFKFELKDADAKLTLGDGSKHAAIYEALEDFWNNTLKPKFDAFDGHVHPTGVGPSGVPAPLVTFPTLPTSIKSTKLNIPDA